MLSHKGSLLRWRSLYRSRGLCIRRLSLAYNLHLPQNHGVDLKHAPIIILHGLFGSKQNNRSISKWAFHIFGIILTIIWQTKHQSISPRLETTCLRCRQFTVQNPLLYVAHLPSRIFETMRILRMIPSMTILQWLGTSKSSLKRMPLFYQPWLAIPCLSSRTPGHICYTYTRRGAKVAMSVALRSPQTVGALIPVDNAPVDATLKSDFAKYVQGMRKIQQAHVTKQVEADSILKDFEEVCAL